MVLTFWVIFPFSIALSCCLHYSFVYSIYLTCKVKQDLMVLRLFIYLWILYTSRHMFFINDHKGMSFIIIFESSYQI